MASAAIVPREAQPIETIPQPDKVELYTRKRRANFLDAYNLKEVQGDKRLGSSFNDACRVAGWSPSIVRAWVEHGMEHPNSAVGKFAIEVNRIRKERNDYLRSKIEETGIASKKWEAFGRLGEQDDPESWTRPKEGSQTHVTVNIVDKLAVVHRDNGSPLTSGD